MNNKFKKFAGFTLIELLVTIVIIGILATISVSTFNGYLGKTRDAKRETDIEQITKKLELYYIEHERYPTMCWRHSNSSNWSELESSLGDLPIDPLNESGPAYDGSTLTYSYCSHVCNGQAYMLVYNKEESNGTGSDDGATFNCNNRKYTYGNAFVTGVDHSKKP